MVTKKNPDTGEEIDGFSATAEEWEAGVTWDVVTEDEGYKIEWEDLPNGTFYGIYRGIKVVQAESIAEPGVKRDTDLMLFTDRAGERCNAFANYRLEEALKEGMTEGSKVKIVWHGKEKIKNESQELNRMSVYVAK